MLTQTFKLSFQIACTETCTLTVNSITVKNTPQNVVKRVDDKTMSHHLKPSCFFCEFSRGWSPLFLFDILDHFAVHCAYLLLYISLYWFVVNKQSLTTQTQTTCNCTFKFRADLFWELCSFLRAPQRLFTEARADSFRDWYPLCWKGTYAKVS